MRRLIGFWLLSLVLVATLASIVTAQIQSTPPRVLSGDDFGFRVDGIDRITNTPFGQLVIRVKGEWVEVGGARRIPATE